MTTTMKGAIPLSSRAVTLVAALAATAALALPQAAYAQVDPAAARADAATATVGKTPAEIAKMQASAPLPGSVLLFPPVVTGADGAVLDPAKSPQVRETQDIVTDALRKYFSKGGVGIVVYNNRLPSIQRAVAEGQQNIKAEVAAKGPGDDPRVAQQLASFVGASEFVTASVDNYQYDGATRRATFNLSVTRNDVNGKPIASFAEKAVGESPADVAPSLQEGSAVARGSEVVAEQAVRSVYPQTAPMLAPPVKTAPKKKSKAPLAWIIPAVAVIGLVAIPR